jgi:acetyl esterase/lipase
MKNSHLLKFRLHQEKWDFNTSVQGFRADCERMNARLSRLPEGVEIKPLVVQGMTAEWLIPTGAPQGKMILYTHGGGYISGSCSDHRTIVAKLARSCGIATLVFDYRLAPEHPYPAALEDALAAYRWMLGQAASPADILIAGESAGGGLALALLLAARDEGLPLPSAAVALSPYTDLTLSGESHRTKASVCLSPPGMAEVCSKYYYGENNPALPGISPLFGDLEGLPPLLIYVGGYETLLDDSTRFAAKAQAAGVDVTLRVGEKMVHCYPLLAPAFPEATQAMDEISAFIRSHLKI